MYFKHIYMYSCKAKLYAMTRADCQKTYPRIVNTFLEVTSEYNQKILNVFINFGSRDLPLCHVLARKAGSSSDWQQPECLM